MKVLMISSDPKILEDSDAAKRVEEYRRLAGELYTIVIAGRLNVAAFFRAYRAGARILRGGSARDFLITVQDPAERWIVGWLLARRFRVPLEVQIHTDLMSLYFLRESLKNHIRLRIAHYILPRASCIRVVSARIRHSLAAWRPALSRNITVLPVYTDIGKFHALHRMEEPGTCQFLMVSRLTREKNIELAIDAFAEIVVDFPNANLIIVGDGPYRHRLEQLASKYDLVARGNVVFAGWEDDIAKRFQQASCYLLTSNYEGYGRTVIEALSAGLPVIMTDVGVAGEVVRNEESGLIVPVGDKKKLVRAMRRFLVDSHLRKTLYENSRAAVSSYPSREEYMDAYKNMWYTCSRKNA